VTGRTSRTALRKAEHLRINLEENVQSGLTTGLQDWRFVPRALPDRDLAEVSTETRLFGGAMGAPLLISCMTGGTPEATGINRTLAKVAQAHRLAIGLGSARVLLEEPGAIDSFYVRDLAPDAVILANLGAVQLNRGVDTDDCRRLLGLLEADALVLHLNALQEALQVGGDVAFAGLLPRIESLCVELGAPVVIKEVGWGIPADDVRRLVDAGAAAVDVAGAGGTSWSEVERQRAGSHLANVAGAFRDWGIPTAEAVRRARQVAPDATLIASGGIRQGMDAAKAIALGADLAGIAGPFLRAAAAGEEHADAFASEVVDVIRVVMFCTGCASVPELRGTTRIERVDRPAP
jgi:isopentenyl-diphosphate delta-isomerase